MTGVIKSEVVIKAFLHWIHRKREAKAEKICTLYKYKEGVLASPLGAIWRGSVILTQNKGVAENKLSRLVLSTD